MTRYIRSVAAAFPVILIVVGMLSVLATVGALSCSNVWSAARSSPMTTQCQGARDDCSSMAEFEYMCGHDWDATLMSVVSTTASEKTYATPSRRSFMVAVTASVLATTAHSTAASAEVDCFSDCLKNCKQIAPKDPDYCMANCRDYCAQDDRKDGLSGSVSSEGGETGILGTYTVVKGEDKPPEIKIPGLDFTSTKGKKLLGY